MPSCPPVISANNELIQEVEVPSQEHGDLPTVEMLGFECPHCHGPILLDLSWLEQVYDNKPLTCLYCDGQYRFQGDW